MLRRLSLLLFILSLAAASCRPTGGTPPPPVPTPSLPPGRPSPEPEADLTRADVVVDATTVLGTVNPLNGVQGGPLPIVRGDADLTAHFQAAGVDHVRLPQDTIPNNLTLGGIFPNPGADPDDPAAYDFSRIDRFVGAIVEAGIDPLWEATYDIGRTDSLDGGDRGLQKGVYPRNPEKWAKVIKNTLMHFNDGWAAGHRWGVTYVEFINEPFGLGGCERTEEGAERCWDLYQTFAAALHEYEAETGRDIQIVGPAEPLGIERLEDSLSRLRLLLDRIQPEDMDYLSIHPYGGDTPEEKLAFAQAARDLLDTYHPDGKDFSGVGLWASEWQTGGMREGMEHSARVGAFNTAVKILWQGLVDRSTLYRADRWPQGPDGTAGPDGQVDCADVTNCIESVYFTPEGAPKPAYFPWLALAEMAQRTPQRLAVSEDLPDIYVMASRSNDGNRLSLLISRPDIMGVSERGALALTIRVDGVEPSASYTMHLYRINAETTSWEPENVSQVVADGQGSLFIALSQNTDTVLYLRLERAP
ncbi:MAG TPA: hypothetical protein G4O00_02045 [Thermoflexia bacterium]|nr:hypothetical protein [Thermoflexia bacterium]